MFLRRIQVSFHISAHIWNENRSIRMKIRKPPKTSNINFLKRVAPWSYISLGRYFIHRFMKKVLPFQKQNLQCKWEVGTKGTDWISEQLLVVPGVSNWRYASYFKIDWTKKDCDVWWVRIFVYAKPFDVVIGQSIKSIANVAKVCHNNFAGRI